MRVCILDAGRPALSHTKAAIRLCLEFLVIVMGSFGSSVANPLANKANRVSCRAEALRTCIIAHPKSLPSETITAS
jgi:hypothetical protein